MKDDCVLLAHGAGGKKSSELTERIFLRYFNDPALIELNDMAVLDLPHGRVSISTDTYVVDPIFFPGGDIGSLAVHGTVNDVAMAGAVPFAVTAGFILEEGLSFSDLDRVASSMMEAAIRAGVRIVTADTKVVPRGAADRLYINTTGIGIIPRGVKVTGSSAGKGDRVLLSGTVGDHGIAVASSRAGIEFSTSVMSDSAPLNSMIGKLVESIGQDLHVLRDPTRGGLATVLCEVAAQSKVGVEIEESRIPVRDAVKSACELLGYDPLYLANEGKLVAVVAENASETAIQIMQGDRYGENARIIGGITSENPGKVILKTGIGGKRLVEKLSGEMLPRIC